MQKILLPLLSLLLLDAPTGGESPVAPPATGRGVIVENVGKGFVSEKAGLRPGDILLAWERLSGTSAEGGSAKGEITSVSDWLQVEVEQGPRGVVRLYGIREERSIHIELPAGEWGISVRPAMPDEILAKYIGGKETVAGTKLWHDVANWGRENGDQELTCWILQRIGEALVKSKDWEAAIAAYESVLKETEAGGVPTARVSSYQAIGRIHEMRRDMEKAEAVYRSALALSQRTWGLSLWLAGDHEKLAGHYRQRGDLAGMFFHLTQAQEIYQKLAPESPGSARILNNLGVIELNRGNLKKAEEYHLRSLKIKEKIAPESLSVAISLDNLGGIASYRGFLEDAENYKKRALDIEERVSPGSKDMAYTLQSLGIIAGNRMDFEAAGSYTKRALDIFEKTNPDSKDLADCLVNMGNYYQNIDELDKASELYLRSLEISEAISPGTRQVAVVLSLLGDLAARRGNLDTAETMNRRALEIQEKAAPGSWEVAYCYGNLGAIAEKRGDFVAAEAHYKRELAIKTRLTPYSIERATALHRIAVLYEKMEEVSRAEEFYRAALDNLEAQVETLGGTTETKANFRQEYRYFYQDYLNLLLKLKRQPEAFRVLERYRAQLFLAMLSERDIVWTTEIPEELEQERRDLAREYDRVQSQLGKLNSFSDEDKERIDTLWARLREIQAKQSEVISRIKKTSPEYASLRYPQPLDVAGVQKTLDPGSALLSYSVGKETGWIFLITPSHFRVIPLSKSEESLRGDVDKFSLAIRWGESGAPVSDSLISQGKMLYRELIGPAEKVLDKCKRILIVPDGPLHNLAFSCLVRPVRGGAADRQYLVEWKPVHTVLSATVFSELKKKRNVWGRSGENKTLVAFGDPDYPQVEKDKAVQRGEAVAHSAVKRGLDLTSLPGTRAEVAAIAALFGSRESIYVGKEATEERAKAVGKDVSFIHFACHGILDDHFPLNSGLALSIPSEPRNGQDNGILQAWEVFEQVRIDANLVALSACETGLGRESGGEGLIGLARAFQYAGARSVLATKWKVADAATSELMQRFYSNLKSGMPKVEALQFAQKGLIQKPLKVKDTSGQALVLDVSHPFYWAAFELIGDW